MKEKGEFEALKRKWIAEQGPAGAPAKEPGRDDRRSRPGPGRHAPGL